MKLITRGQLHSIVTDTIHDRELSLDYQDTLFLQDLTSRFEKLPGRWMNGDIKNETIRLGTDMVSVEDAADILECVRADGQNTYWYQIVSKIREAVNSAGHEVQ